MEFWNGVDGTGVKVQMGRSQFAIYTLKPNAMNSTLEGGDKGWKTFSYYLFRVLHLNLGIVYREKHSLQTYLASIQKLKSWNPTHRG